jgi:hypothetical protein
MVTAVYFSLGFSFLENESAWPSVHGRVSMVFCSASSLFHSLLLTKAIIFLFTVVFVITSQESKMREGQRQTLNRSSSTITNCPTFPRLASSNNITSHNIAASAQARIVSSDRNPKQRQQCDIADIIFCLTILSSNNGEHRWQQQDWQKDWQAAMNKTCQQEDEQ